MGGFRANTNYFEIVDRVGMLFGGKVVNGVMEEEYRHMDEVVQERLDRQDLFEAALEGLPVSSSAEEILSWIAGHPAMSRLARLGGVSEEDGKYPVILGVEDIEAPHGRAPCLIAVNQLQVYANSPGKFFQKMLERQTKVATGKGKALDGGGLVMDDVGDIEKMLRSVASQLEEKKGDK